MKKILIYSLFCLGISTLSQAQCYMDRHSATWYDGWISCQTSPSPNPARGNSHWIQYNLGESYVLHEMFVWNTNAPDLLDWGMQEIAVDVSGDGVTWVEVGTYVLNQGTGFNRYEGEFIADLNNTKAKYVLITGLSNYGGACYGISEVKINVDNTVSLRENDCIRMNLYPNPFSEALNLNFRGGCSSTVAYYSVSDALGRIIIPKTIIKEGQTITLLADEKIFPGVYFVKLISGSTQRMVKAIKQGY